jgi:hypothetical protein
MAPHSGGADRLSKVTRAKLLENDGATLMNDCLELYRQMEDLYRLRALVDEIKSRSMDCGIKQMA